METMILLIWLKSVPLLFKPNSSESTVRAVKMNFWKGRDGWTFLHVALCVWGSWKILSDPGEPNKTLINTYYCQHQNKLPHGSSCPELIFPCQVAKLINWGTQHSAFSSFSMQSFNEVSTSYHEDSCSEMDEGLEREQEGTACWRTWCGHAAFQLVMLEWPVVTNSFV